MGECEMGQRQGKAIHPDEIEVECARGRGGWLAVGHPLRPMSPKPRLDLKQGLQQ